MLTKAAPEDWLAIFQKLTAESCAKVYRSSKEAKAFLDDNAAKMQIISKRDFAVLRTPAEEPNKYEVRIMTKKRGGVDWTDLFETKAPDFPENLREFLTDHSFQLFFFDRIYLLGEYTSDYKNSFWRLLALLKDSFFWLMIHYTVKKFAHFIYHDLDGRFPCHGFSKLKEVPVIRIYVNTIQSWAECVVHFFEELKKQMRGEYSETWLTLFMESTVLDEELNEFLTETPHECFHLAENVDFNIVFLPDKKFIVLQSGLIKQSDATRYTLKWMCIDSETTFNLCLKESFCFFSTEGIQLDEILALPAVDALRRRLYP